MVKREYFAFDVKLSKPVDSDDSAPDAQQDPDESDDDGKDPTELILDHLYWWPQGATVAMISRRNDLAEDVVRELIDELLEETNVEATTLNLQSKVHGEKNFAGFVLTSECREQLDRENEEMEAELAIEAGEKKI